MIHGRAHHLMAGVAERVACLRLWMLLAVVLGTLVGPGRTAVGAGVPGPLPAKPGLPYSAYLPIVARPVPTPPPYLCPATSSSTYNSIPYNRDSTDNRPAAAHGDLNLALRGYIRVSAPLQLVSYNGGTDPGAPQMTGIFANGRTPSLTTTYQVYSWNWGCGPDGCRGALLSDWPVTLLGMRTNAGEPIRSPWRGAEIYGGGYITLVLFADNGRITLKYSRDNTVASGYTVHIEGICVDANLLSLYRSLDAQGRPTLPALRNDESLGTAAANEIAVAIRDSGAFMDPRSSKDWWQTLQ